MACLSRLWWHAPMPEHPHVKATYIGPLHECGRTIARAMRSKPSRNARSHHHRVLPADPFRPHRMRCSERCIVLSVRRKRTGVRPLADAAAGADRRRRGRGIHTVLPSAALKLVAILPVGSSRTDGWRRNPYCRSCVSYPADLRSKGHARRARVRSVLSPQLRRIRSRSRLRGCRISYEYSGCRRGRPQSEISTMTCRF